MCWKKITSLRTPIDGTIDAWLGIGDKADFFKISLDPENTAPSYLSIDLDDVTAQAVKEGILQFTCRDEKGRTLALYEVMPGQLNTKKAVSGSEIYIGVTLKKKTESIEYSFDTALAIL